MEKEYINKLLLFIKKYYEEEATIKTNFSHKYNIFIASEKYDLNIGVGKVTKEHFLYGKYDYYLNFSFEANKKYRMELSYHGGGYSSHCDISDFSNVNEFLDRFCKRKKYKQITIFDIEGDDQ